MAVVSMKRLELCGLKRDRKEILELLQKRAVVEVEPSEEGEELFAKADTSGQCQEFLDNARLLEQAVELLDHYAPPKKGMLSALAGRTPVTQRQFDGLWKQAPALLGTAKELLALGKERTDGTAQILRLEAQVESLKPWLTLDIPMNLRETESTRVFLGAFPQELDEAALKNSLARLLPQVAGIEAEVLSSQPQQTCVFVVCCKRDAPRVEEALRSLGFTYPSLVTEQAPQQQARQLEQEIQQARQRSQQLEKEIAARAEARQDLLLAAD